MQWVGGNDVQVAKRSGTTVFVGGLALVQSFQELHPKSVHRLEHRGHKSTVFQVHPDISRGLSDVCNIASPCCYIADVAKNRRSYVSVAQHAGGGRRVIRGGLHR